MSAWPTSPEWLRSWWAEIPPHSYALLRIALGASGVLALVGLTPFELYWPLDGLTPVVTASSSWPKQWLVSHGLGTAAGWALYLSLWVVFVAMTIGAFSELAVLGAFVGQVLIAHWNNTPLSAAHQVETVLVFCLLWAPTGRVWSVDQWWRRKRGKPSLPDRAPAWPLMLMRCQVALIYLGSGLHKLAFPVWRDGSAVYWSLALNDFHRIPWTIPPSAVPFLAILAWGTLFFELLFPVLVFFRRTRMATLIAGIGLHLGLWATLELGPFSWLMMASYIAFVDPERLSKVSPSSDKRSGTPQLATLPRATTDTSDTM